MFMHLESLLTDYSNVVFSYNFIAETQIAYFKRKSVNINDYVSSAGCFFVRMDEDGQ